MADAGDDFNAFLYSHGTMTDLGTVGGYQASVARGINAIGQVVGYAGLNSNIGVLSSGGDAFLYSNGVMTDLNTLIPPSSGWTLSSATAINDFGQIVGWGDGPSGEGAFLLTPVPEPSTLVLLGIVAIGLLGYGWRKLRVRQLASAAVVLLALTASTVQAQGVFNMPSGETSLSFVPVGNPGNAPDPSTGFGSVGYAYQMGEYDVTVGQYVQFLNAVAKTDTYGLYSTGGMYSLGMDADFPTIKIARSGSSGGYSYSVAGGYSQAVNCPIFDVTWGDAARFCNWLQNGQPTLQREPPVKLQARLRRGRIHSTVRTPMPR